MPSLGCLLLCTFGNSLAHALIAAHTFNNLDFDNESENKDYEGEGL